MEEQEYETIDLREIFQIIQKNLLVIIAATLIAAVCGYVVTQFFITPKYKASATMIVNAREDIAAQTVVTNDQLTSASKLVETYSVILKSDTVLDKTIADLSLPLTYDQLAAKVSVTPVNSTQVMEIAVIDESAETAQQITQSIVDQAPEIIGRTVNAGSVQVISEPKASLSPVSPNKWMNTAIAGLIGAALSVGAAFLRDMMNNKVVSDSDITRKLGLTVLGVIPRIDLKE